MNIADTNQTHLADPKPLEQNVYQQFDALGLAEQVRLGEISAEVLLETAIKRTEAVNPQINAVITKLYDFGRHQIRQGLPNGPFTGVPFLLKDLLCSLAGTPMSQGSNLFKGVVSTQDSEMVCRYKNSGLVIFGKTSTPEFGLMGVTEPEAFGACRNPWNLEHTPGGSSGGAGASVAAGIVPMASGGDGGGSIRIPAACCGLFGLKPSRGRTPTGPDYAEIWDGAAVEHVITRSVRDSAAMLDVLAEPDDLISRPNSFLAALSRPVRQLRIGFTTQSFLGQSIDPVAAKAVEHTRRLLSQLGHEVEEASPDINGEALADSYLTMYFGHVSADLDRAATQLNKKLRQLDVEETTKALAYLGNATSAGTFVKAKRRWQSFALSMQQYHQKYDLLLTPTLGAEPATIGAFQPSPFEQAALKVINRLRLHKVLLSTGMAKQMAMDNLEKLPFTQLANLTGAPAMSVPLFWSEQGLPLGVQFMAPMGDEVTLLQLARQLEVAQPWFDRRPDANEQSTEG